MKVRTRGLKGSMGMTWAVGFALVMLAGPAAAQIESASAMINVTARVVQGATVRGVSDLSFGDIVAPANSTTREVGKADPNAGLFEVVGADGQGVQVSFLAPTRLTRAEGGGSLPIDLSLYGAPTRAAASGAEQVFAEGTVTLQNGRYYFFLAGSLTVQDVSTNPAGTYTGEFELSITHTTI